MGWSWVQERARSASRLLISLNRIRRQQSWFDRYNAVHLITIRDAAVVLSPCGPLSVTEEIRTGDVVVNSDFGTSQAGEVLLSHVSARAIEAVCLLTIDSLDLETLMRTIP